MKPNLSNCNWTWSIALIIFLFGITSGQGNRVNVRNRHTISDLSKTSTNSANSGSSVLTDIKTTTCQCGVFLLGTPPLEFSADATPALSGNPVATNCSASSDRTKCSSSCRQLVQAMGNQEDSPLVQTVVLAATKALACQKFNSSTKVPLPRIHVATPFNWRVDAQRSARISEPRWLGGFYRWCDSHWVYAGVSVSEPLCCSNGLPIKCPDQADPEPKNANGTPNNRNPRLIIKKRPEDDLSSEEIDPDTEIEIDPENDNEVGTSSSSTTSKTTTSDPVDLNNTSMETIEPFGSSTSSSTTSDSESKLNSTILAEAFQFVGALMRSVGMSDVVDGISAVLPTSTATELLKRVDVGGWVGKYQDRYIVYNREFNLGYCYAEYGLYNVANEGVGNMVNRVFGGASKMNRRARSMRSPNIFTGNSTVSRNGRVIRRRPKPKSKSMPQGTTNSTRRQNLGGPNGPNLLNIANMVMQLAGASGGGGGGGGDGDKIQNLLQNALPMVGQVASSPMIQGVVSNLVTSFLTPPSNDNRPPQRPNPNRPEDTNELDSSNNQQPLGRPNIRPGGGRPPRPAPPSHDDSSSDSNGPGVAGMLGQIVQTYVKHYLFNRNPSPSGSGSGPSPTSSGPTKNTSSKNPDKNSSSPSSSSSSASSSTTSNPPIEENIVDAISEVAKPFFISYFGVVPGIPGFGQLSIAERSGRFKDDKLMLYDPDPGTSISDLLFGAVNLPSTGNPLFDFGNRIVYGFSRANDPTQGLYCFKQYCVNKAWDGFRFGVKTLFK